MRISHKHKFVFVAVPKTGCCSARNVLDGFSDVKSVNVRDHPLRHHTTLMSLQEYFTKEGWEWDKYIKLAGCRNPWDRIVSDYFYQLRERREIVEHGDGKRQRNRIKIKLKSRELTLDDLKRDLSIWEKSTFKDFVLGENGVGIKGTFSSQSQLFFMTDGKEQMLADFVIRMENIEKDMKAACSLIGIPFKGIPRKNTTKHKHYTEYYDDETREIVAEKYAKDIEYFGYKFGE